MRWRNYDQKWPTCLQLVGSSFLACSIPIFFGWLNRETPVFAGEIVHVKIQTLAELVGLFQQKMVSGIGFTTCN